ncbi:MAG: hypothetical protein JWR08_45 [Enterovirga sp.]|nr:hypothetical protein [Enterovirga sp.]
MIVRRFLLWARNAPAGHRAEATGALARAYLYSDLAPEDRAEAETALTAMLDDPSALVRRAMAESLAPAEDAPRHVVVALASDQDDVAEIVLARSPLLADADLVDCAALGSARIQRAIASRRAVSPGVAAALAEIGRAEAILVLVRNPGAAIGHSALARIVERHGGHALVREALLARPDLPLDIAQSVAVALAASLESFVTRCGWLSPERSSRAAREARERTTVALATGGEADDIARLVSHLRRSGQLTPGLILRALLSGQSRFAAEAFSDLTDVPAPRALGILQDGRGHAFRALYDKAGMPGGLRPVFEAAALSLRDGPAQPRAGRLSRGLVVRALNACSSLPAEEAGRLAALLRRFEVEAARDEARDLADELADGAALAIVMKHAPEMLDEPVEAAALAA